MIGSDYGTLSDPNYLLKRILKEIIFHRPKHLVQRGVEFDNPQGIFQGDRTGPNVDGELQNFVDEYWKHMGYKSFPQA